MSNRPDNGGADHHSMSGDGEDWASAFDHFLHHELSHPMNARQVAMRGTGMSPMFTSTTGLEVPTHFPGVPTLTLSPTAASARATAVASNFGNSRESASSFHRATSSGADDDNNEDDPKDKARSERKRTREKQRRSDVNQQFSELSDLLRKIEESEGDDSDKKKQRLGSTLVSRTSSMNRIDLIARAIGVLNHLHDKNQERSKEIKHLKAKLDEAQQEASKAKSDAAAASAQSKPEGKPDQVVMMLPMMMPSGPSNSMGGVSASAMAMANPMQQFMAQMASQSAYMQFPFMTPHGFPAASMPNHVHPPQQQMHIPTSLPMSAPPVLQAQQTLQTPNSRMPPAATTNERPREVSSQPVHTAVSSSDPQQPSSTRSSSPGKTEDSASEYDPNKKPNSTNLAHCA